jgi:FkbM family methyltransferase
MNLRVSLSISVTKIVAFLLKLDQLSANQKFVKQLIKDGFEFRSVYDVGAYKGDWTREIKLILPNSEFFLFEGNEDHESFLQNVGSKYCLAVLSDADGERNWWSIAGTGDSLFRENHDFYEHLEPAIKFTRTLDNLISEMKLPPPDLIKIDVQGAEIEVLKGASVSVQYASIVILEVPIIEYNIGAPQISDYLNYMKSIGFFPLKLLEIHYSDGLLVQIDIGFAKRDLIVKHYPGTGAFLD